MDGILGKVDTGYIPPTGMEIYSHGNWPVKQLQKGQTIRFRSKNYENPAVMRIEGLRWFDRMVIASGSGIEAAFGLDERVEIVTVKEAETVCQTKLDI